MPPRSDPGSPAESKGFHMNSHLRTFVQDYLRVVLGTVFVVASVVFVSVPGTLGQQPGHELAAVETVKPGDSSCPLPPPRNLGVVAG